MIKAIIFDLGGVIISPEVEKIDEHIAKFCHISLGNYSKFISSYKQDLTSGKTTFSEVYKKLAQKFNLHDLSPEDILQKHLSLFRGIIQELNQDIINLVKILNKKYIVVCMVNAEKDVVPLVRKRGIYNMFQHAYISADLGMQKPDKNYFLYVLGKIKCTPSETLFIDDKTENVESALSLGIKGIQYKWGNNLKETLLTYL